MSEHRPPWSEIVGESLFEGRTRKGGREGSGKKTKKKVLEVRD